VRLIPIWVYILALILCGAGTVVGQDASKPGAPPASSAREKSAITGTVSDQAGAGVGGATIKVSNSSGVNQSATTDDQGLYAVTDLAAGTYNVSVIARGAKVFEANIVLSPGQVLTLSVAGAPVAQTGTLGVPPSEAAPPPVTTPAPAAGSEASAPVSAPTAPASTPQVQATTPASTGPGSIGGAVNDQTGAVVVGATVKVTGAAGVSQTTVTDAKGLYSFKGLPAGSYSITVTAKGFKAFQADHIGLAAGADVPLDAGLEPEGEKTEVNVQAGGAAQIETENASVSGTITQKEVSTLGLNGRNFSQLITLTPGVSNQTGQDEAKVGVQGSVKYSVNGGRVEYNSFEVDGSDVLNAGLSGAESTLVVYPSLDAIQEVKVLTSNYGAQFGRTASGTVQVVTKSGGNQWHGNGYEFLRNEFFNARNYFDQTTKAPLYRRNDFGYTIGGPLKKEKTFIFFSEEFRFEKSPSELRSDFNHAVPTVSERQGNFSDVCPNPSDPQDLKKLGFTDPANGVYTFHIASFPDCPFVPGSVFQGVGRLLASQLPDGSYVNNDISHPELKNPVHTGLDPNAVAILNQNLIPLPNSYTGCTSSLVGQLDHTTGLLIKPCYVAVISEPTHWREELFRLDHNFSPRLHATFRYIHDSWDTVTPVPTWSTVNNTFPTVQNKFVGPGTDAVVRLTQTISSSMLNETVFSFTNSHITLTNVNGPGGANFQRPAGLGDPAKVGQCTTPTVGVEQCPMGYLFNNGFGGKVPGLVLTGNNQAYGGSGFTIDPSYMPWEHTNPTYNFRDDITKALGKHTLQFGVQIVVAQKNETNGALSAATGDTQGLLTVSNVNGGFTSTGNAFANFLYNDGSLLIAGGGNAIQSYTQDTSQQRYYNRYQIAEPYVQDDWKVTSHLTVNLGLRLSVFGNYNEKYHQAYNWDPNAFSRSLAALVRVDPITGQLLDAKTGAPIPVDLNNLDPRITNGIVQCGTRTVPAGCVKGHLFNPAPRIGFAWAPGNGKTSIRAGYGLFFEHGTGDEANTGSLEGSAPLVLSMTEPFPVGYACIGNYAIIKDANGNLTQSCNPSNILAGGALPSRPGAFPLNVLSVPANTKFAYSQQWSLSIQRELPRNFVATFAYVGSKGTHLTVERQLNQLAPLSANLNPYAIHEPIILSNPGTPGDCQNQNNSVNTINQPVFHLQNGVVVTSQNLAIINLQIACQGQSQGTSAGLIALTNSLRPYPGLGEIFSLQNGADSSYHGFQATIRRTKGPLTAGVAYSFSHSIDDSSDRTDPTFVNSLDLRSNKASSGFDQRHLLNVSYVYSLPRLSQGFRNWSSERAADSTTAAPGSEGRFARLIGDGWQWSGITTFQTGTPFSVINNAGTAGIGVLDNAGVANGVGAGSYPDLATKPAPAAFRENPGSFGPLLLNPNQFVAPRGLTFGNAGRNFLNNPSRINFDMSLLKHFPIREGSEVEFRAEAFNIFNHTQFRIYDPNFGNTGSNTVSCYGGPNYSAGAYFPGGADCLTGNSFLHPIDAHRPRTIQLGLKYNF
jgi:hypothetical protein